MANSSKQDRERLSEAEEKKKKKTCMGKNGENGEYREETLAVMGKEVMAVSLLCRDLSPTLLQVSQQEMSGSIRRKHV